MLKEGINKCSLTSYSYFLFQIRNLSSINAHSLWLFLLNYSIKFKSNYQMLTYFDYSQYVPVRSKFYFYLALSPFLNSKSSTPKKVNELISTA